MKSCILDMLNHLPFGMVKSFAQSKYLCHKLKRMLYKTNVWTIEKCLALICIWSINFSSYIYSESIGVNQKKLLLLISRYQQFLSNWKYVNKFRCVKLFLSSLILIESILMNQMNTNSFLVHIIGCVYQLDLATVWRQLNFWIHYAL